MVKKLCTHDGVFHADEVMATAILKKMFEIEIVRSRQQKDWESADIVYDVGGGKYDHHTVDLEYRANEVPYASAGLIWRDYGKQVVRRRMKERGIKEITDINVNAVVSEVDGGIMQYIDAMDNGVELFKSEVRVPTICTLIGSLNPSVFDKGTSDEYFEKAVGLAEFILDKEMDKQLAVLVSEETFKLDLENIGKYIKDNRVIVLSGKYPWRRILLGKREANNILFVIYQDNNDNSYKLQSVPKERTGFENRKDLPEEWAGKRDEELSKVIGIDDAVFCHPGRFIASAKSFESILKMAKLAINN